MQEIPYSIIGGLNVEAYPVALPEGQAQEVLNFLPEKGVLRSRPSLQAGSLPAMHVDYLLDELVSGSLYQVFIGTSSGSVILKRFSGSVDTLTGVAPVFGNIEHHNATIINGAIIVGNVPLGALRHLPTGTTMSQMSDAKYRYFTGLASRAIGAYRIESGNVKPREVGWSVGGDETDWTGIGSGTVNLAEVPDEITGIYTVQNTLVVLRDTGLTLGYPTNVSLPAFRFEILIRKGEGCRYPATACQYNEELYYVSEKDVHRFSLRKGHESIGVPIRKALFENISRGAKYRGFVTTNYYTLQQDSTFKVSGNGWGNGAKEYFHLAPYDTPPGASHFVFDLEEQKWSRHNYNSTWSTAAAGSNKPVFFTDSDPSIGYFWVDGFQTDSLSYESVFRGRPATLEPPQRKYYIQKILIMWSLSYSEDPKDDLPPITVGLNFTQDYTHQTRERLIDVSELAKGSTGSWFLSWFDIQASGQLPELYISVPAELKVAIGGVRLYVTDAGASPATATDPATTDTL